MPLKCCCGCVIITDSFVGGSLDEYDQRSGTWEVVAGDFVGNEIHTSDDNAIIIRKDFPTTNIEVNARGIVWPASMRLIVGWLDDDNYHYVECRPEIGGETWMQLRIVEVADGVETQLTQRILPFGVIEDPLHKVRVCYRDGLLSAHVTRFASFTSPVATISWRVELAGELSGFGVGTAQSPSRFFTPQFERDGSNSTCPTCALGCCGGPFPSHIRVVLHPYTLCPDRVLPDPGTWLSMFVPLTTDTCEWAVTKAGTPNMTCTVRRIPGVIGYSVGFLPDGFPFPVLALFSEANPLCEDLDETPVTGTYDCDGVPVTVTGHITAEFNE